MKTSHLVMGIVLVILGVLLGIVTLLVAGQSCAPNPITARLIGVISCDELLTQTLAFGGGSLLFLIIGGIVLAAGREKGKAKE